MRSLDITSKYTLALIFLLIVTLFTSNIIQLYSFDGTSSAVSTKTSDWANLARYNESSTELSQLPAGTNQVVFMGDSITDFWTLNTYFPGKSYINRGIGGQTTPQILIRFRPDVIELKPEVVVILCGTNDIAGNTGYTPLNIIQGNLRSMAEAAVVNGIKVVMASILPVCGSVISSRPSEKVLAMNEFIKAYCEETGAIYLDYYSAMVDSNGYLIEDLTYDCLHPNSAGYDVMKPLVEAALQQALA